LTEYAGCLKGLQTARERGFTHLTVKGDSLLVVKYVGEGPLWLLLSPNLLLVAPIVSVTTPLRMRVPRQSAAGAVENGGQEP
jgi:hypothetical protein